MSTVLKILLSIVAAVTVGASRSILGRAEPPGRRGAPSRSADHHQPVGGFRNPWPTAALREKGGLLRWQLERLRKQLPPDPAPQSLPRARSRIRPPGDGDLRITWVGHSTFLIQIGSWNLLTDPQWSARASPFGFAGPARFTPPGVDWDELPRIDAVLISHDHYDHLDHATVLALASRFGPSLTWFTPLGYRDWFSRRGVESIVELDWWDEAVHGSGEGALRVVCLPAQHWTSRTPWGRADRLWASWAVEVSGSGTVYFGGDSGYFPEYPEIARRVSPLEAVLLPIGAYEPRWFMRPVHMNPEEAVSAYRQLGGAGVMLPMHWGTWRLTDEDPLEPPERVRSAWEAAGLARDSLRILRHGETWVRGEPAPPPAGSSSTVNAPTSPGADGADA